jgi:hypothetical protein
MRDGNNWERIERYKQMVDVGAGDIVMQQLGKN